MQERKTRRTGWTVAFLAAAILASPLAGPVPAAAASEGRGGLPVWAADFMAGATRVSRARAVAQARTFDVIAAVRGTYREHVAAMKKANPNLVLLVYLNGALAQSDQGSAYPADWYARDARGRKIRSRGWGNYLMKPDDPRWVEDVVQRCTAFLAESGYDGCFIDMLGIAPLLPNYVTGLPIDPSTGRVWRRDDWLDATTQIAAATREAVWPRPVYGNGLSNGWVYYSREAPAERILDGLDGAMAETFVRDAWAPVHSFRRTSVWKMDLRMLGDVRRRGETALAMTKVSARATKRERRRLLHYSLGTFLLGYEPGSGYFSFRDRNGLTTRRALWKLHLGDPASRFRRVRGVYRRWFDNGVVLVNPGSRPLRIGLPRGYRRPGGRRVTSVVLGPHTARILRRG